MKKYGIILLGIGLFLLIAAILFAMSIGGPIGITLLCSSIAFNSAAIMLLTSKKK